MQYNISQDKAIYYMTRKDNTIQATQIWKNYETSQARIRQGKARQPMTQQNKRTYDHIRKDKKMQDKTIPDNIMQGKTM